MTIGSLCSYPIARLPRAFDTYPSASSSASHETNVFASYVYIYIYNTFLTPTISRRWVRINYPQCPLFRVGHIRTDTHRHTQIHTHTCVQRLNVCEHLHSAFRKLTKVACVIVQSSRHPLIQVQVCWCWVIADVRLCLMPCIESKVSERGAPTEDALMGSFMRPYRSLSTVSGQYRVLIRRVYLRSDTILHPLPWVSCSVLNIMCYREREQCQCQDILLCPAVVPTCGGCVENDRSTTVVSFVEAIFSIALKREANSTRSCY